MIRPVIKLAFLAKAAFEVGRERLEDCLDSLTAKAGEYKSSGSERVNETRDRVKDFALEVSQQVWQRSEVLEGQVRERIKRQVADFSLGALGDSTEINELTCQCDSSIPYLFVVGVKQWVLRAWPGSHFICQQPSQYSFNLALWHRGGVLCQ